MTDRRTRRDYGETPVCDVYERTKGPCPEKPVFMFHLEPDDPEVMINTAFGCPEDGTTFLFEHADRKDMVVTLIEDDHN